MKADQVSFLDSLAVFQGFTFRDLRFSIEVQLLELEDKGHH